MLPETFFFVFFSIFLLFFLFCVFPEYPARLNLFFPVFDLSNRFLLISIASRTFFLRFHPIFNSIFFIFLSKIPVISFFITFTFNIYIFLPMRYSSFRGCFNGETHSTGGRLFFFDFELECER